VIGVGCAVQLPHFIGGGTFTISEVRGSCMSGETSSAGGRVRLSEQQYIIGGVVSGVLALVVLWPVFGPISILCGAQVYRRHSEPRGLVLLAWGLGTTVFGYLAAQLLVDVVTRLVAAGITV